MKDAGKTLVQVVDNGCGMSETDARLCFERHATSKIRKSEDLGSIKTLGFRGEALASIAAIAQVEMKSKKRENELGTHIVVEGSTTRSHEPCSTTDGTSIAVKNLFFNVPARRKFLKSNNAEMRHILEEFHRIAIANPDKDFALYHNDRIVFQLYGDSLKRRIVSLFGTGYDKRLLAVKEETESLKIGGFIGKPEFAKKTRGEQYFFVNGRFIRHPYLHHAVANAFQELIPKDAFPTYFITMDADPESIDINIHPTKTEINFENSQFVYNLLKSAVKKALGQFNIDSLDFEKESSMYFDDGKKAGHPTPPKISVNPDYNPFETAGRASGNRKKSAQGWEKVFNTDIRNEEVEIPDSSLFGQRKNDPEANGETGDAVTEEAFQMNNSYLVTKIKSGIIIIDQHRAHQRILFERFLKTLMGKKEGSQQQLFPVTVSFSSGDAAIIKELIKPLQQLGFDIGEFGPNTLVVRGIPAGLNNEDIKHVLERIVENYKRNLSEPSLDKNTNLARSMAANMSIKPGKKLQDEEIRSLINQLFSCDYPGLTPDGRPSMVMIGLNELAEKFK